MGEFPSGQRGQTVNLLAMPSVVRIHLPPPNRNGDRDAVTVSWHCPNSMRSFIVLGDGRVRPPRRGLVTAAGFFICFYRVVIPAAFKAGGIGKRIGCPQLTVFARAAFAIIIFRHKITTSLDSEDFFQSTRDSRFAFSLKAERTNKICPICIRRAVSTENGKTQQGQVPVPIAGQRAERRHNDPWVIPAFFDHSLVTVSE